MSKFIGGYDVIDYSPLSTFATCKEIGLLKKEGTNITPETPVEEFANNKEASAGKYYTASLKSALLDDDVYADLVAAEEALTPMFFRYHCLSSPVIIEPCEAAWSESAASGVTPSADSVVFKKGLASSKFVIDTTPGTNAVLATQAITALNLTARKYITLWLRSSVALAANDLQLLLDDTASCASPIKSLNIPAIAQDTWTKVTLDLGDASGLTAVISVGIKQVVDVGAFTLNIDEIRAVMAHYVVKNAIVQHVQEPSESGKHHARSVVGKTFGKLLSDVIEFNA